MKIRTLTSKDLPAVRAASRKASLHQDRTLRQWELAALKYVDYYPCHAGDTSLGLELEDGTLAGYVLCATDPDAYFRQLEQEYAPAMEALLALLKEKGIPGVCLGVDSSRKQAVHFYEKNGFHVLRDAGDTLFMGRSTD